jgi:hypothetical protein
MAITIAIAMARTTHDGIVWIPSFLAMFEDLDVVADDFEFVQESLYLCFERDAAEQTHVTGFSSCRALPAS